MELSSCARNMSREALLPSFWHSGFQVRDEVVMQKIVPVENGYGTTKVHIDNPKLWYPHGYGAHPLYEFSAEIVMDEITLDKATKRIGLRRSELVQNDDTHGKSFYFRVNGVDVFCGGNCWIPADNFIPRISKDRYRRWLKMMVNGGQVMTRVWGGGIYEEEIFYDLCDELGILVWQDFMFACASYPTWPDFLDSVQEEATQNVNRLRHHPCINIYAGNNEDYQVREHFGLAYNFDDKDPSSWLKTNYPARYIFEQLLPQVMGQECPSVPYWPSSPYSEGKLSSDPSKRDFHQWNVWHGTQEKYQVFESLGGRFNSEFGIEAFPHIQTIRHFVENKSELHPQSHTLDFHNKADGHQRRIATYLVENFRTSTDLESYIHLTQLVQSEALMFAYRGWRKQWGDDRKCGGALVWQMNDVWSCTSWAIVDYSIRKKLAYYTMARSLASIAIGVQRRHHDWSVSHARPRITFPATFGFTGREVKDTIFRKGITINQNGTTDVLSGVINTACEPYVLAARLFVGGECASRDSDWPQPFKYLSFEDRGVTITTTGERLHITAKKPTKGLVLDERDGVSLSDNAIDAIPGDEQIVTAKGLQFSSKPLSWKYLGQ